MGRARGPAQPARAHVVAITDLPLFAMLRTRMQWHQERQRLLAENVANADTPTFRPRDLSPLQFGRPQSARSGVSLDRTDATHFASFDGGSDRGQTARYG